MAITTPMPVTSAEKSLQFLLRFWIAAFTVATIVFFFFEGDLIRHFNGVSESLVPSLPLMPIPQETPSFWVPLVGSLMVTLIAISYWVQKNVRDRMPGLHALLLSKFLSSLFFFLLFAIQSRYMAYLIASVVDGSIFLVTFYFVRRMAKASSQVRG